MVDDGRAEVNRHGPVAARAVAQSAQDVPRWVDTFALFSDPSRMKILIAIHAAPDSAVSEIASATHLATNTVTQALRTMHDAGVLTVRRDGRYRRWTLSDDTVHELLHRMDAPHSALHPEHGEPGRT